MRPLSVRHALSSLVVFALLAAWPSSAHAQDAAPPGHVAVVDGSATLETERGIETAQVGIPLMAGDRIRTSSGRVEVVLADGSALDLDEFTTLDVASETLLRVYGGRAVLTVIGAAQPQRARAYQIDTPVASVRNEGPGEIRIAVRSGIGGIESEVAVLRGRASVTSERGSVALRAGELSVTRDNEAPGFAQAFNSARGDAFDRWTSERRDDRLGSTASSQYLPDTLRAYGGTLDHAGSWSYQASYGYVWYPTVATGWRPYYNGYWTSVQPYGWTWVGHDPWGWPTHHYGRWGFANSRWFWIPGNRWGAAWVSWIGAPGYVGWSPLGYYNTPVFSFSFSTSVGWPAGWVVVPRAGFGVPHGPVPVYALRPPAVPGHTPFVARTTPPVPAPLPGTRAVPRAVPRAALRTVTPTVAPTVPRTVPPTIPGTVTGSQVAIPRADFKPFTPPLALPRTVTIPTAPDRSRESIPQVPPPYTPGARLRSVPATVGPVPFNPTAAEAAAPDSSRTTTPRSAAPRSSAPSSARPAIAPAAPASPPDARPYPQAVTRPAPRGAVGSIGGPPPPRPSGSSTAAPNTAPPPATTPSSATPPPAGARRAHR
jgi:hypothetical protein